MRRMRWMRRWRRRKRLWQEAALWGVQGHAAIPIAGALPATSHPLGLPAAGAAAEWAVTMAVTI